MAAISSALFRRLNRLPFDPVGYWSNPRKLGSCAATFNPVGEVSLLFADADPHDLTVGQD